MVSFSITKGESKKRKNASLVPIPIMDIGKRAAKIEKAARNEI